MLPDKGGAGRRWEHPKETDKGLGTSPHRGLGGGELGGEWGVVGKGGGVGLVGVGWGGGQLCSHLAAHHCDDDVLAVLELHETPSSAWAL